MVTVKVGFFADATYADGTPVAAVAYRNEFGDPANHQPPRPFFRNMVADVSPNVGAQVAGALRATNYDADKAGKMLGEYLRGELARSINTLQSPALSPVTVAKKGFAKPLIDTARMLDSIAYETTESS